MKNLTVLFAMLLTINTIIFAQGVGINSSGADADASAMLDVSSTTKGFLPPRMTAAQRTVISSPAAGLLVYQTDGTPGLYYYNGSSWEVFATGKHYIGESYGGGIVFWVDATGQLGLIAAASDQSTSMRWYAGTNTNTMARGDGVGGGGMNTAVIIANQGIGDVATYAARVCAEYNGGNYGDWYLPSKYELNLMYTNLKSNGLGGFASSGYWSSTELTTVQAWIQNFSLGSQSFNNKSTTYYVRAVRAF